MEHIESSLLRRVWFPVARSEDVTTDVLSAGRILDEDLVLWRDNNGQVTVSSAQCPHRGAYLPDGDVVAGALQCPYHGWLFQAGDGVCVKVPSSEPGAPLVRASLRVYPARERYGHVWTCLDDPFLPMPTIPALDTGEWTLRFAPHRDLKCGIRQLTENFRDMAHFAYVHTGSMGPNVQKVVPSYEVERTDFTLSWTLPTDLGGTALGARETVAAGQTFNYRLQMPTVSSIETVFDAGGRRVTAQIVTPVSADGLTARQFWLVGIDSTVSGQHGVSIDEMYDFEAKIFAEDVHIVEKQVPREAPLDGAMQVHSRADKYSLVFRRAYKELMAKASQPDQSAPAVSTATGKDDR